MAGRERRGGVERKGQRFHSACGGNGTSRQNDCPWGCGLGLLDVGILCGEAPVHANCCGVTATRLPLKCARMCTCPLVLVISYRAPRHPNTPLTLVLYLALLHSEKGTKRIIYDRNSMAAQRTLPQ